VRAQDLDALAASHRNFLYVRVANTGNMRLAAARVRLYELEPAAAPAPVPRGDPFGTAIHELAPGESAVLAPGESVILEVPYDLGARDSGSRIFVLALADDESATLDAPDTLPGLEGWHTFALHQPAVALREFVVA
jgi:hypothetical protein